MSQLAATYQTSAVDVVAASARAYTNAIRSEISGVTTGGRLRGVGKRGARVGVKYDVQSSGERPTAFVQATGPLQLIERDTAEHQIPRVAGSRRLRTAAGRLSHKREGTGRNLNGAKVLKIQGEYRTGPITHPGTKGKHPFERGVAKAEVTAVVDSLTELHRSISRIFH